MKTNTNAAEAKQPASAGCIPRLVLRFRCLGRHQWKRVSTQHNGIGFLDECTKCGRGRFLAWAGHASTTGQISAAEMQQWHQPDKVKQEVLL
jgi:hypothetical protein